MRELTALVILTLVLSACGGGQTQAQGYVCPVCGPQHSHSEAEIERHKHHTQGDPGRRPDGTSASAEGKKPGRDSGDTTFIRDYRDLDEYAGQSITVEGIFKVYPKYKGRHGMIVLDGGMIMYMPHAEFFWRGEDWWNFEDKRCRVTGILYTSAASIDGMKGPFFDQPTVPAPTGGDSK